MTREGRGREAAAGSARIATRISAWSFSDYVVTGGIRNRCQYSRNPFPDQLTPSTLMFWEMHSGLTVGRARDPRVGGGHICPEQRRHLYAERRTKLFGKLR